MSRIRSQLRRFRRLGLLAGAVAIAGGAHAGLDTTSRTARGVFEVPTPGQARLGSLGFDAALADYYWLRTLELVGGENGAVEQHGELIADVIDVITSVDPWVDHPYRFATLWLTASPELVERGSALMERGISYHPLDWRNRYHLGFNLFFHLERNLAAADVLETAVPLEGAPHYLAPLVARLRANDGGLHIAAAFLARAVEEATDEFARAEYMKALDEIEVERRARFLDAAREEYWKRNGRDIERVEDLLAGPNPVLQALPRAQLFHDGFHWMLSPEDGQIVSSYYGGRYELHVTESDRARRERWRAQKETAAGDTAETGGEGT